MKIVILHTILYYIIYTCILIKAIKSIFSITKWQNQKKTQKMI